MRKKIIAGNWKMNKTLSESKALANDLKNELKTIQLNNTRIIIAPTFINLTGVLESVSNTPIEVAAQNAHQEESGAYTGEVAMNMLAAIGIKTIILGHSERRKYFNENKTILTQKVKTALKNNLEIIFCFGEDLEDRKSNNHFSVVESQISDVLFALEEKEWTKIILAYEPVWAIGTGETATANQAQEMHTFIRKIIAKKYHAALAENISILYGGSCKPNNASEIFAKT